jgi:hypothetical protein
MIMEIKAKITDEQGINSITAAVTELEEMSRDAHTRSGFTYAPLSELHLFL